MGLILNSFFPTSRLNVFFYPNLKDDDDDDDDEDDDDDDDDDDDAVSSLSALQLWC